LTAIVRGGGHPGTASQIKEQLKAAGFNGIETCTPSLPLLFVLGYRQCPEQATGLSPGF
jgi:hypothetical protein